MNGTHRGLHLLEHMIHCEDQFELILLDVPLWDPRSLSDIVPLYDSVRRLAEYDRMT
jgi:hypothetical protein